MEEKNHEMIRNVLNKINVSKPKKGVFCTNLFGDEERFEPFKNKGRPFLLETEEDVINAIISYFRYCEEQDKPYAMSGLAISLGMTRQTLYKYSKSERFGDIITMAKERVQQYAEEQLFSKNAAGAKFSLSANFGWAETSRVENSYRANNIEDYLDDDKDLNL